MAVIRSEEELTTGVARRSTSRVRIRKYVVTEDVTQTFAVSHEEIRVEREDIAGDWEPDPGEPLSQQPEHDIILSEERLVVTKQIVPVERVRLTVDIVTVDGVVIEDLRKERIAAEGTGPAQATT